MRYGLIGEKLGVDHHLLVNDFGAVGHAVQHADADAFVHLFSNDNPLVRAARDVGMAVVNRIGPARRFFMTEAGGAVGDLPKLLRGEAI